MMNIEERLLALEGRVSRIEEQVFRTHRLRKTVLGLIARWPGQFTVQQIESALKEFFPQVSAEAKPYAVSTVVNRLEKSGQVVRMINGTGCTASVFQRVGKVGIEIGNRPGRKYNRRAEYESGFRNIVRTALAELPKEFTLADLRSWMAQKIPDVKIPYGSMSSTLYKLQQQGELVVVKKAHTLPLKVWSRGEKVVQASGEEMSDMQAAWEEFRKEIGGEQTRGWSEAGSILERAEAAA